MVDDQNIIHLGPSVTVTRGAIPKGDIIFISIDSYGNQGLLNSYIFAELGLEAKLPDAEQLKGGFAFQTFSWGAICFIVTVGLLPTAEALTTNLSSALRTTELSNAQEIWLPLLGTGAGGLGYDESFSLTLGALQDSEWLDRPGRHATISTPLDISTDAEKVLKEAIEESAAALNVGSTARGSARNPYALPKTAAVDAAIGLAATFTRHPRAARRISSSLIFFALAESQSQIAPEELKEDPAAEIFALAVQDAAGSKYEVGWQRYFKTRDRPKLDAKRALPRATRNIEEILFAAYAIARSKGAKAISIDHLIHALLGRQETRLQDLLAQMSVDPAKLLADYVDARVGQITTKFKNDVATDEDHLGYNSYADAMFNFLTHAETPPPLSISIQAPWGAGKSSLMKLVRERLDPKVERHRNKSR